MPFLDQFEVILFDLNGTFMFGHDRFGPDEDYFATYRSLGGARLGRNTVMAAMHECCAGLLRDYETPSRFDDFPALPEAFREFAGVADEDLHLLEQVFAAHEIGQVPDTHAIWLRSRSATHKLGVVSNICGQPAPWREQFDEIGLLSAFTCTVFSSEGRSIKPSPEIFRRALQFFPGDSRILFVGDSLERDIVPARALGLATAWVAGTGSQHAAADVVVDSIVELDAVAV